MIRWRDRAIEYANRQAIWADGHLSRFVADSAAHDHRYLRLDYDTAALGPLLKESLPHVHVEGKGEPRFPLPWSADGDVVGWFLDFVYRNFFYDHGAGICRSTSWGASPGEQPAAGLSRILW